MLLPKRSVYCLLFSISVIGIIFRYPLGVSHELGADTTFVHSLSESLLQGGHAAWVINPYSYFGLYALSYPSANPFLFALTSSLGNLSIEASMLVCGWTVTLPATLGCYLVAKRIRRDDVFALLTAALVTLSPFFVKDTFWVGSSRGYVVALLPAVLLLILRQLKTQSLRDLAVALAVAALLASIHRMGLLVFLLFVAYIFTIPFHKITLRLRIALFPHDRQSRYGFLGLSFVAFLGVLYVEFLYPTVSGADLVAQYGDGVFLQGQSFPIVLANMLVSITGRVGILTPMAVVGLVFSLWHRPKETSDKFVLVSFLLMLPLLSFRDYVAEFMIFFFVTLSVIGLLETAWRFKRKRELAVVALVAIVVGSGMASWVMKGYWQSRFATDAPLSESAYGAALYFRNLPDGNVISNDGLLAGQLTAISGRPTLPLGGASLHWTGAQQLIWGFVPPRAIETRLLSIYEMSFSTNEIFVPTNVRNAEFDWEAIMFYTQPSTAKSDMRFYNIHYAVIDKLDPTSFLAYNRNFPSGLLSVASQTDYAIYDSGQQQVWLVG